MTTRTPEELEEKLHYHFKNKELLITAADPQLLRQREQNPYAV